MAQVWRLEPEAYSVILTSAGIATGGYELSSEVDNSTGLWPAAWFFVDFDFSSAPSAGVWIHVSIARSADGTNYDVQDTIQFQEKIVASLKVRATDTTQRWAFYLDKLPPAKFKLRVFNGTAVSVVTTDSTVGMMRVAQEVAAA